MRRPEGWFYLPQFRNDECIFSRISVEMGEFLKKNRKKLGCFLKKKMVVFDIFYAKNLFERLKCQFSDKFFGSDGLILCIFFSVEMGSQLKIWAAHPCRKFSKSASWIL